jgi:hypothetical protein
LFYKKYLPFIYKDTTKQKTKTMKCSNIESNTEFYISGTLNQYFTILLLLLSLPGPFVPVSTPTDAK